MLLADDLEQLLNVLPTFINKPLQTHPRREYLIEIVLDIGRRPEARFSDGSEYLSYRTIVWQDIDSILKNLKLLMCCSQSEVLCLGGDGDSGRRGAGQCLAATEAEEAA